MDFSQALVELKAGQRVQRAGWNGRGMWLVLVPGSEPQLKQGSPYWVALGNRSVVIDQHIDMFTAKGTMQPGWLASQADMLADDWCVVD